MSEIRNGRSSVKRQAVFLGGLTTLLLSLGGYIWIQTPLRESIALEKRLAVNVGRILTLDERLTMSARMAAATKDPAYQERYNANIDQQDGLIQETIGLVADPEVIAAVRATDEANEQLGAMELRSFELDNEGRHREALELLQSDAYRRQRTTYAEGMRNAFNALERLTAARTATVERWALALQLLALASLLAVLGAWTLEQRERQRQATRYASELEAKVHARTRELAERNRSMRLVLDNVQQGLVGVDAEGFMASERSAMIDGWFGAPASRIKLADYVRSFDPTYAEWFELGIDSLREGFIPLEVTLHQLPRRLRLGRRTIAVEYENIQEGEVFGGLLVIMSDITADLERERVEAQQKDLIMALEIIARDRVGFMNFLAEANGLVDEILDADTPFATTTRLLHTLKGNAAQFGMSSLARECHRIEEQLRDEELVTASARNAVAEAWRTCRESIRGVVDARSTTHFEVEKTEFANVVQLVRKRGPHEDVLRMLESWALHPVQARLDRLGESARALADRLGKPGIKVICQGGELKLDNESWVSFWSACVHLVRNAVDHGIEPPEARAAGGKRAEGRIELTATLDREWFTVSCSDDGRGVDWELLRAKAREAGRSAGDKELMDLLFEEGLSTRDDVTEVSGRGIGLTAFRQEVVSRSGTVSVKSELDRGTTISARFPASVMTERSTATLPPRAPEGPRDKHRALRGAGGEK